MNDKVTVVVADDQRFARMYVDMYVKMSQRYEIAASFPTADDVLEYLKTHSADLVILDVVMERGTDGLSAAEGGVDPFHKALGHTRPILY